MEVQRTRRGIQDEPGSLEELIEGKRRSLVVARMEAPALREEAQQLRRDVENMTQRWQRRPVADKLQKASELEEEADVRESMKREYAFEASVVTYLRLNSAAGPDSTSSSHRKTDTIKCFAKTTRDVEVIRSSLRDEYLFEMNMAPTKVAMAMRDVCPRCPGDVGLLLQSVESTLTCPTCGYAMAYLDATSASIPFDDIVDYAQYSYKRVNHYLMHLSLVQGKEVHRVPDDILQRVMQDLLHRQGVTDVQGVTCRKVRDALRHNRLRKGYDHVAQITSRLSGVPPKRLSHETEEQLRTMFLQMLPAFQRHASKHRTNFLSYTFVIYRCFQILGLHDMLDGIALLKGRDKLEANNVIFEKMCKDLGWRTFPLPPESETMR